MIEIVPNWHPIFVHFSIALYTVTAALYLLNALFPAKAWSGPVLAAARVNLWLGAAISVLTVAAGIRAFLTIPQDASQAAAVADHRNWAIITAIIWWLIAIWEIRRNRRPAQRKAVFVFVVLLALIPLGAAGWKGGEVVYRHGVGVLAVGGR